MLNKTKQFFLNLIDNTNPSSSKRFAALIILATAVGIAITATVQSKGICPDSIFNSLLIYGSSLFGYNMIENLKNGKISENDTDDKNNDNK